jgi:cation transport ATPase
MTTQEIWQLQTLEAPRVSAAYMRYRTRDLARRRRIRRGSVHILVFLATLFFAWSSWRYLLLHRPLMSAGPALWVLACVYLTFHWHRRASASQGPEDAGVLDSLSFYRRELERQRDARRRNWRWELPLFVPGLIAMFSSLVLEFNRPWALVVVEAILIVGIATLGVVFEERSARRLQREIDALDSLVVKDSSR